MTCQHAFRVLGSPCDPRRLTSGAAAFVAHTSCDPRADLHSECFLSAFWFDEAIKARLRPDGVTLDVRGFVGPCWSPWVWVDIDCKGRLDDSLSAGRKFAAVLLDRYSDLDEDDLLYFWSGSKGVHVGFPTAAAGTAAPSVRFPHVARRFAVAHAERAGVTIDTSIYEPVRLFRAPNSRHPKTNLHKRRLTHRELFGLPVDAVLKLSSAPAPFDPPDDPPACPAAAADWHAAEQGDAASLSVRQTARGASAAGAGSLQRDTLDLIHGTDVPERGTRERRVFRAAADLTLNGCPLKLVRELLDGPARDCGLKPSEVAHAIASGVEHGGRQQRGAGG